MAAHAGAGSHDGTPAGTTTRWQAQRWRHAVAVAVTVLTAAVLYREVGMANAAFERASESSMTWTPAAAVEAPAQATAEQPRLHVVPPKAAQATGQKAVVNLQQPPAHSPEATPVVVPKAVVFLPPPVPSSRAVPTSRAVPSALPTPREVATTTTTTTGAPPTLTRSLAPVTPKLQKASKSVAAFTAEGVSAACFGAPRPLVFGHRWPAAGGNVVHARSRGAGKRAANLRAIMGGGRRRLLAPKASSKPFTPRCNAERSQSRREPPLSPGESAAAACLSDPASCKDPEGARQALRKRGVFAVLRRRLSNCLLTNGSPKCKASLELGKNAETGKFAGPERVAQVRRLAPKVAHPGMFSTCALIGNGPGLRDESAPLGEVIDRHDAVFKSNLYNTAERPGKWADGKGHLHGSKSTFRVFNKKRAEVASTWDGDRAFYPGSNETWLFWHYGSASVYAEGLRRNPGRVYLMSPQLIQSEVDSYFALRKELLRLRVLGQLFCPMNMPTGLHTLFLALKMCRTVNLFGFSYNIDMLQSRSDGPSPRVSAGHAWDADTLVLSLLALTGHINLCTT